MKPLAIQIIQETEDWVCIHKPPYVPSMPERGKYTAESVIEWAQKKYDTAILCHRLDRETSGVMVVAKTPETHRHLSIQFEHRKITKRYHAIADGAVLFNELVVDLPINTDDLNHIKIDRRNGKQACTTFHTIEEFKHFSLIECRPKTGRLHQIRVHLASQNAKIAGDIRYGSRLPLLSGIKRKLSGDDQPMIQRFALHAFEIEFENLDGTAVTVQAPYAKDFEVFLKLLRKYDSKG
jgi:23S rRNA pseudouridine955/2504/2580 synthase